MTDSDNDLVGNLVSWVIVKQAPPHPSSPPGTVPTDLCHWQHSNMSTFVLTSSSALSYSFAVKWSGFRFLPEKLLFDPTTHPTQVLKPHCLTLKTNLYRRRGNSGGLTPEGYRRSFLSYKLGWKVFLRGRTFVLIVLGTVSGGKVVEGPVTAPPGGTAIIEGGTLTWINLHWSIIMAMKREIGGMHLLLTFFCITDEW